MDTLKNWSFGVIFSFDRTINPTNDVATSIETMTRRTAPKFLLSRIFNSQSTVLPHNKHSTVSSFESLAPEELESRDYTKDYHHCTEPVPHESQGLRSVLTAEGDRGKKRKGFHELILLYHAGTKFKSRLSGWIDARSRPTPLSCISSDYIFPVIKGGVVL